MGFLLEDNGKEKNMCATLAEVRTCLAEVPQHMRWALNEVRTCFASKHYREICHCFQLHMFEAHEGCCQSPSCDMHF